MPKLSPPSEGATSAFAREQLLGELLLRQEAEHVDAVVGDAQPCHQQPDAQRIGAADAKRRTGARGGSRATPASSTCRPLRFSWRPAKTIRCSRPAGSAVRRDEDAVRDDLVVAREPALRPTRAPAARRRCGGRAARRGIPTPASRTASSRDRRSRGTSPTIGAVQIASVAMHGVGVIGSCRWTTSKRSRASACLIRKNERGLRMMFGSVPFAGTITERPIGITSGGGVAVAAVPRMEHARELAGRVVAHDRLDLVAERCAAPLPEARRARRRRPRRTTSTGRRSRPSRRPLSSARGAPPLPSRSRDPPARAARARRPRRGAALRARRHGDRRASRTAAARGPRPCRRPCSPGTFTIFNFLTYGTTAVVARAAGAGQQERAARLAAQALWVALAIGVALARRVRGGRRRRCCAALGGARTLRRLRAPYFRIARARPARGARRARRPGLPARRLEPAPPVRDRRRRERANVVLEAPLRLRLPLGSRGLGRRDGDRAARDGGRVRRRAAAAARRANGRACGRCGRWSASAGRSSCGRRR